MGKLKVVHMRYVTKPNTDDVFDLFKRLMFARDSLRFHYADEIDCDVKPPGANMTSVFIRERQPGKINEAVKEYLSIVNSPAYRNELEYSQFGSDFGALEVALPPGKALKRKFKSLFLGKYIVDSK